jgi:beta-glucanase (GH16 family)
VFDHEFYLILNLAMGGNFTGAIDPTLTSANMSVDWVRVSTINGVGEVIQH